MSEADLMCHPELAHPDFQNLPELQYPWKLALDLPVLQPGASSELKTGLRVRDGTPSSGNGTTEGP